MATGDFTVLMSAQFGDSGTRRYNVALNASNNGSGATYIPVLRPGELVARDLGAITVTGLYGSAVSGNTKPVVSTDYLVGLCVSPRGSTETDLAAGIVDVMPLVQNVVYLGNPNAATSWDTQAEYDALVGKRVLIDLASGSRSAGAYTVLASDSSTSGILIMPLDITKYPAKVAFCIRQALSDTN